MNCYFAGQGGHHEVRIHVLQFKTPGPLEPLCQTNVPCPAGATGISISSPHTATVDVINPARPFLILKYHNKV